MDLLYRIGYANSKIAFPYVDYGPWKTIEEAREAARTLSDKMIANAIFANTGYEFAHGLDVYELVEKRNDL